MGHNALTTRIIRSAKRNKSPQTRRRGVSTVEFAIVAPILFLVLLSVFQFAGILMNYNVLTAAAREGGRVASMPNTSSSQTVVSTVEARLQSCGINPDVATVSVTPATISGLSSGAELNVSVSVPLNQMGWIWAIAPPDVDLSTEITYERE